MALGKDKRTMIGVIVAFLTGLGLYFGFDAEAAENKLFSGADVTIGHRINDINFKGDKETYDTFNFSVKLYPSSLPCTFLELGHDSEYREDDRYWNNNVTIGLVLSFGKTGHLGCKGL